MNHLSLDQSEALKERFLSITNIEELVDIMNYVASILYEKPSRISIKQLCFFSDPKNNHLKYNSFSLKKKSGKLRVINAPKRDLKFILRVLNEIFQAVAAPSNYAFGFVKDKSIVDNARVHINSNYVYNIDLEDFFHSFTYRSLIKLFKYEPFNFKGKNTKLCHLLAGLCTCNITIDGESLLVLPQGSPTSPTLSNLLCDTLDYKMNLYSERRKCKYTRYADDITFSSDYNIFDDYFHDKIDGIIKSEKLEINPKKTRLQRKTLRQEVTGLVVNEKVNVKRRYVKQIRMWLYFWEKYGLEKAQQIYQKNQGIPAQKGVFLDNVLRGKLLFLKMVKGDDDSTFKKLISRFEKLINNTDISTSRKEGVKDNLYNLPLEKFDPKANKLREFTKKSAEKYFVWNPKATLKDYIMGFYNEEEVMKEDLEKLFYYFSDGYYEAKGEKIKDNIAEVNEVYNTFFVPFNAANAFLEITKELEKNNGVVAEKTKK